MKLPPVIALFTLSLLPLAAKDGAGASPAPGRAYLGVVMHEEGAQPGLEVNSVAPSGPAGKAGIRSGDRLLRVGQVDIRTREDLKRAVAASTPGEVLPVVLLRGGSRQVLQVRMVPRPAQVTVPRAHEPKYLGADKYMHPITLPDDIRQEIRRHRRLLREQLAALPDGLQPAFVTDELNAIRNLARDARASRSEWMSGRAGEISVRFRDAQGSVVLYGANNLVSLELYDTKGQLLSRHNLNTQEERRALPPAVLQRLLDFR